VIHFPSSDVNKDWASKDRAQTLKDLKLVPGTRINKTAWAYKNLESYKVIRHSEVYYIFPLNEVH